MPIGFKAERLRVNLRLVIQRLKLLEKKKSELAQKARKEIADYLSAGKDERARIRVEHIIREDYLVEAMEVLELFCELLLTRFGLIKSMKELDPGLQEAVSTLIWAAHRLEAQVAELKIVSQQLCAKYSKEYGKLCMTNQIGTVNERLMNKMSVEAPPKILVERYLIEIAKNYNVPYDADAMVLPEVSLGNEAALIDVDNYKKPGGGRGGGGDGGGGGGGGGFTAPAMPMAMPMPEAFNPAVGSYNSFPHTVGGGQPPQLPTSPPTYESVSHPLPHGQTERAGRHSGKSGSLSLTLFLFCISTLCLSWFSSCFVCTGSGSMDLPVLYCTVLYCTVLYCTILYCTLYCNTTPWMKTTLLLFQIDDLTGKNSLPSQAIAPSSRIYDNKVLPDLPSVPDTLPPSYGNKTAASDDIDFDDLSRRFEELKKKT
uniref:IST1 homolog isoform X2 n=1 Tax=Doryrhamphus excisus TaxID=161450 RepID=UPI0025AE1A2F|nr:IST1 homolog isoform X2 [Doryrhamphus excisus]